MCGIVGLLATPPDAPALAQLVGTMNATLAHRGPDAEGILVGQTLALGHRRLSIIDLQTGDQPMSSEDGSVSVVFNGEIYNYQELRQRLIAKGHSFRTDSDTEVIVHQYEEDGVDCVRHFRGMFAFAIWDERLRSVMLARDRFGIKPLFIAEAGGRVAFSSEIKALLTLPWVDRSWDATALRSYLGLAYITGPRTAYRGVRQCAPGTVEVWRRQESTGRWSGHSSAFWGPSAGADPVQVSYEAAKERVLDLLKESVRLRLRSDVPLGAFLSGGVDSSAVVALMRLCGADDIKTFSIGFDDDGYDELPYALEAARHLRTDHHTQVVGAADAGLLPDLLRAFDEPFGDSSAVPTFLVSRLAREHVTVSLSGDGGDELFAGYYHYGRVRRFAKVDALPLSVRRAVGCVGSRLVPAGVKGGAFLRELGVPAERRVLSLVTSAYRPLAWTMLGPSFAAFLRSCGSDELWQAPFLCRGSIADAQLVDQKLYLPDDILTKVDRCSMAVSLEARVPLLDHRLAEYVNSLPTAYKLSGNATKRILKDVIAPYLPRRMVTRAKQGFSAPLRSWLSGPLRGWVSDTLLARDDGLFDRGRVSSLLAGLPQASTDVSKEVWAMLSLATWVDQQSGRPW